MKPNRHLITTILKVLFTIFVGALLLSSCATTGRGKEAGPQDESSSTPAASGSSVRQATATTPVAAKATAASTRVSAAKPAAQKAPAKTTVQQKAPRAATARRDWGRLFREALSGLDWNRVLVVVGGILGMAFFWILAFWLGRLRLRRGPAPRRAAIRGVREPVPAAAE